MLKQIFVLQSFLMRLNILTFSHNQRIYFTFQVLEENLQFMQNRDVYNEDYFRLIYNLCSCNIVSLLHDLLSFVERFQDVLLEERFLPINYDAELALFQTSIS